MRLRKNPRSPFWWVDLRPRFGRYSTGKTDKAEAESEAARILVKLETDRPDTQETDASLRALHAEWARTLPVENRRARDDVKRSEKFVKWFGPSKKARTIRAVDVSRWTRLLSSEGLEPETVRRHTTSLSCLFRWAIQFGHMDSNPTRDAWKPPTGNRMKRTALSPEEVQAALDKVRGTPLEAAYHLAFFAGFRRSEIAAARFEDVDFIRGTVLARGSKTEGSIATLPLHSRLGAFLQSTGRTSGPIVANKSGLPYHPSSLENLRREIPGLPNFHRGRHTLATTLVRQGVDIHKVSAILRHTSVKTTESFYAWAAPSKFGADLEKFQPATV